MEDDNYDVYEYTNIKYFKKDKKDNDKIKDKLKRRDEPTGEAETLIGRKLPRFGDLAQREKIPRTYLERRKNEERAFG